MRQLPVVRTALAIERIVDSSSATVANSAASLAAAAPESTVPCRLA